VITPAGDVLAADAPVVAKAPQTGADTLPVIGVVREIVLVGCPPGVQGTGILPKGGPATGINLGPLVPLRGARNG
jgi:hypothetical protein